jgi:hypothetical protein
LKMDLIEGSETSANINQTLGIHPKIETVNLEILADRLNTSISVALILLLPSAYKLQVSVP